MATRKQQLKQDLIERLKGKKSEPTLNITNRVELIKVLNQYHSNFGKPEALDWIASFCKEHNLSHILKVVRDKDFNYPMSICTIGFCCRLSMRGCSFIDTQDIIERLEKITAKEKQKKQSKTHRINPLGVAYDTAYDTVCETGKPQQLTLSGSAADIADVLKQARQDLDDVVQYPKEYKHAKALQKFLEAVLGQKPVRKTVVRASKPKPPSKLVSKLRYAKTFPELDLKSINPEKIIGAVELFAYDTERRQLSLFVAPIRLTVNGINICDYDPEKSFAITIRKPQDFFSRPTSHRSIHSRIKELKTVRKPVRQRLTTTTILLSAK